MIGAPEIVAERAGVTDANGDKLEECDHDIDCKIDAIGGMQFKSQFAETVSA
ncbi:MAG: hypothetical protein P8J79_03725 [Halioglobus sp.]|nr:hypothetical protein [Halioglobus sp.]